MKKLFEKMNGICQMPPELMDFLVDNAEPNTFKKSEVVSKAGRICEHVHFIETGLLRHFVVGERKTYTPWALREGDFVTSVTSFQTRVPALDTIIAVEDTDTISLSFEKLQEGCELFPELKTIQQNITDRYRELKELRDFRLGLYSPMERYMYMVREEQDLLGRLPVRILASYLQVSAKTLFDIRRKLAGRA